MTSRANCICCVCTVRTEDFHGTHYPKQQWPAYLRSDQRTDQGPDPLRALSPGDALPSIRGLAKDLKISVITTKRAYDELEAQGLINTVAGKGCFVAEPDLALFREQSLHLLEDHLAAAAELARTCGLSESELAELLRRKWEGSL